MNSQPRTTTMTALCDAFQHYVQRFAGKHGDLPPMLQLKVNHTRRVTVDSRRLAGELEWPSELRMVAEAAALFHDIGRFEQCRRYGTFADIRSVDHGELGVDVLDEEDLLRPLADADREVVRETVRQHNKRDLPETLPQRRRRVLSLVRDADKIDIMRIIGDAIRNGDFAENPEVLLNVKPDGPPTQALVDEIRAGATGSYANVKSLIDMKLVGVAWTRDIGAAAALRLVRERGLLDGFLQELKEHPAVADLVTHLERQLNSRLRPESQPATTETATANP